MTMQLVIEIVDAIRLNLGHQDFLKMYEYK